jgi:hypothetical protein
VARLIGLILILLLCPALLAACGDDDDDDAGGTEVAEADTGGYCELSAELDRAGQEQFEALEEDGNATEADFEAAEREFVESHEAELEEIQELAPDEIAGDVALLVEGLRARAGLDGAEPSGLGRAEERVDQFETQNC